MSLFTNIIKKLRSSIFVEYAPMFLITVLLFAGFFFFSKKAPSIAENNSRSAEILRAIKRMESEQPPRITGNETEEEIYNNPYIKHIRTALNGYLDGSNIGAEETIALYEAKPNDECGLKPTDKEYYRSKFFIFDVYDNEYGGVEAQIIFVDKPDTIFGAWVYKLGNDDYDSYSLRNFCKSGPPEEKRVEFNEFIQSHTQSGKINFSL